MKKKENSFPPVKIAVLIDGGFFVKRFNSLYNKDKKMTGAQVANHLYTMAMKHVGKSNTLNRFAFFLESDAGTQTNTRFELPEPYWLSISSTTKSATRLPTCLSPSLNPCTKARILSSSSVTIW